MQNDFSINKNALEIYRDYQYERANIYYQKEVLGVPAPWTNDPFLSKYKFTNIRRELDRESKFLIDTVIGNDNLSRENKALNCALFRCINSKEGTNHLLNWPIDFDNFNYEFSLRREQGVGIIGAMQSNAYFLSNIRKVAYSLFPDYSGTNTSIVKFIDFNRDYIINALNGSSPEDSYTWLLKVNGFGEFMAYQIWVDFTYLKREEYPFGEDEFVISGPGCSNGIDWMLSGDSLAWVDEDQILRPHYGFLQRNYLDKTYEDFIWWFTANLPELMSDAGLEWNPERFQHFLPENQRDWNVMSVENSLCEFNKLMKLRNNIRMRARYYYAK